jgi:hypothetical protein
VNKAIEMVDRAKCILEASLPEERGSPLREVYDLLGGALLRIIQAPRWETPEQRKERTGEEWPDNAPVWVKTQDLEKGRVYGWSLLTLMTAKEVRKNCVWPCFIICATEAGPPPDGWEPEEETP